MLEKCIGGYTSTVSELPKPPEKHHYRQQFLRWIRNSTTELQIQLKTVSGQWYFLRNPLVIGKITRIVLARKMREKFENETLPIT